MGAALYRQIPRTSGGRRGSVDASEGRRVGASGVRRARARRLHGVSSARDLEQSPSAIADHRGTAADDFLRDIAELSAVEYDRTGRRSDGYLFTVRSLLQYFFHELVHHSWDVSGETFGE